MLYSPRFSLAIKVESRPRHVKLDKAKKRISKVYTCHAFYARFAVYCRLSGLFCAFERLSSTCPVFDDYFMLRFPRCISDDDCRNLDKPK